MADVVSDSTSSQAEKTTHADSDFDHVTPLSGNDHLVTDGNVGEGTNITHPSSAGPRDSRELMA
jgi:hypothetical protein